MLLRGLWPQLAVVAVWGAAIFGQIQQATPQGTDWIQSANETAFQVTEDEFVTILESDDGYGSGIAFYVFCERCTETTKLECRFRRAGDPPAPSTSFFEEYIQVERDPTSEDGRYNLRLTHSLNKEDPENELPDTLQCDFPAPDITKKKDVVVVNVNDNPPQVDPRCEAVVGENEDYTVEGGKQILDFMNDCGSTPSDLDGDDLIFKLPPAWDSTFEVVDKKLYARTKETFDFESTSYYSGVKITVQDRPEGESDIKTDEMTVVITVVDKQDRAPQFLATTPQIELRDGAKKDDELAVFRAEDGDTPDIARAVNFEITKGTDKGLFRIETEPYETGRGSVGRVFLVADFDLEAQAEGFEPFFQLEIEAREVDDDGPILDANAAATYLSFVAIRDIDDNDPEFVGSAQLPPINVTEHDPGFSQNFTVFDKDYDLQAYKVEISTEPEYIQKDLKAFRLIPAAGFKETPFILTVNNEAALDYEQEDARTITITVSVFPESDPERKHSLTIILNLEDDNDQTPQFTKSPEDYTKTIPEGVLDLVVMTVEATDADTDDNYGTDSIRFSIFGAAEALQLFSIDEKTGEIRTSATASTDFETGQHPYELIVVASDKYDEPGVGVNRNQTTVTIKIQNVNDEAPIFAQIDPVKLAEDASDFVLVHDLAQFVQDADYGMGETPELSFSIELKDSEALLNNLPVAEDLQGAFEVKKNGDGTWDLKTVAPPDRETVDTIRLHLVVNDEQTDEEHLDKKTASCILTITIEDRNDFAPVISIPPTARSPSIPEQTPDGRVLTFSVEDKDATGPNNEFVVSVQPADSFALDCRETNYCDLLWTKAFDRESDDTVTVLLSARDRGDPQMDSTVIEVQIRIDKFLFFQDNTTVVPAIAKLSTVIIRIDDVNDNKPQFTNIPPLKPVELVENLPAGEVVFQVDATDDDTGINANLCFDWGKNNVAAEEALFEIGKLDGVISVQRELDRERFPNLITLEVVSYDKCNENTTDIAFDSQSDYSEIQIQLLDENDNTPEFPKQPGECFFDLDETANNGDRADRIIYADDPDLGKNGSLAYSLFKVVSLEDDTDATSRVQLVDGAQDDQGRKTAQLEVLGEQPWIDQWGKYTVFLTASDMDGESGGKEGTAEYTLCVKNVNNHPPEITEPTELDFLVLNDHTVGELIPVGKDEPLRVVAKDDDGGLTRISYEATSELNHFGIHRDDGILTVARPLTGEVPWCEAVRITAKDSDPEEKGQGLRLEALITLQICVTDNTNRPAVIGDEGQHQELSITENDPDFSALVHRGVDPDPQDTVFYHLVGGPRQLFNLDPLTGNLTLEDALDREQLELPLVLVVRVTDKEDSPGVQDEEFDEDDKALLEIVIEVLDVKDVPTTFSTDKFTGAITLDASAQQSVLRIFGVDPDLNTKLEFSIDSAAADDTSLEELNRDSFEIREVKGEPLQAEIVINFEPQPDMRGSMTLQLSAWDPDDPTHSVAKAQAILRMLVKENQITLEFINYYKEVESRREELKEVVQRTLGDPTNSVVLIDKIEGVATTGGGSGALNRTVVATHFQRTDGAIVEGTEITNLLQLPDKGAEINQACKEINLDFFAYSVGRATPPEEATIKTTYFFIAVAACGIAVVGLLVLALLYIRHTGNLKRQVKAMTTTTFGSQESGMNRLGLELPNTNAFAHDENPLHNLDEGDIRDDASSNSGDSILIGVEDNPEFNAYQQNQPKQEEKPGVVAKKKRPAPLPPMPATHMGMINPAFTAGPGDDDSSGYGDFDVEERRVTEDPFGGGQQRINPLLQLQQTMNFEIDEDDVEPGGDFSFGPPNL